MKKSLFVLSFVCELSMIYAQPSQTMKYPVSSSEKYEIRNLQNHKLSAQALEDLLVTIKAYMDSREVQNAQQMYELVTKIRQNERNMHVFECYNVIRSFLRVQDNRKNSQELYRETERLVRALIWLVSIESKKDNQHLKQKPFYSQSSNYLQHTYTLTQPDVFIHLNATQQQFCIDTSKEIAMVANAYALGDDLSAEDGTVPTTAAFSHNLKVDQAIIDYQQNMLGEINQAGGKVASASKEEVESLIKQIVNIMNNAKRNAMIITIDGKKLTFPHSKNLIREIRKEGGNVITMLQNKLNTFK